VQTVCIQEDGVHLTPKGQEVYFNAVYDTIEKKLPNIK
jgi:lysophospholipase L1-like esterase